MILTPDLITVNVQKNAKFYVVLSDIAITFVIIALGTSFLTFRKVITDIGSSTNTIFFLLPVGIFLYQIYKLIKDTFCNVYYIYGEVIDKSGTTRAPMIRYITVAIDESLTINGTGVFSSNINRETKRFRIYTNAIHGISVGESYAFAVTPSGDIFSKIEGLETRTSISFIFLYAIIVISIISTAFPLVIYISRSFMESQNSKIVRRDTNYEANLEGAENPEKVPYSKGERDINIKDLFYDQGIPSMKKMYLTKIDKVPKELFGQSADPYSKSIEFSYGEDMFRIYYFNNSENPDSVSAYLYSKYNYCPMTGESLVTVKNELNLDDKFLEDIKAVTNIDKDKFVNKYENYLLVWCTQDEEENYLEVILTNN